jgi:hypothetical protein
MRGISIDYDAVRSKYSTAEYDALVGKLRKALPSVWQKAYRKMVRHPTHVLRFSDRGVDLLFDHVSELVDRGSLSVDQAVEDRVVVAFGRTNSAEPRRVGQRVNGLLGAASAILGGGTNRDHVPGGLLGATLDVCLFPQRRDLGREWSSDGRTYRAMEHYCAENPGTFAFTRLIYDSTSWWPCEIEHGLLRRDGTFWISIFENVTPQPLRSSFRVPGRSRVTTP